MKKFMFIVLFVAGLFSVQAEARSFYRADMKVSVQYSDIENGTIDLLNDLKVTVRYSDDHDFCQVVVGQASFKCHSYHPDDQPEQVMITMDRGIGAQVVAAALANCKIDSVIQAAFARLSVYLDDTINIEWQGDDFYQQIHDVAPESFHVFFFEMTKGVKY